MATETEETAPGNEAQRPQGLSVKQERAALLEARGYDSEKVAKELGLASSTIRCYRMQPEYRAAVRAVRDEIYTAMIGEAILTASENVRVLSEIRDDPEIEPQHRIRAAMALMSQANHGHGVAVMGERLDEVRRAVGLD